MVSRKVAVAAALSLLLATGPAVAQQTAPDQTPTAKTRPVQQQNSFTSSGLFLMLSAVVGAVLLTVLATQIGGDEPASP